MSSRIDPTQLDRNVRGLLRYLLDRASFEGRDALRRQVSHVTVAGGPITMLRLELAGSAPVSKAAKGPIPGRFIVSDDAGSPIGELLVWVKEGRLSVLEFAWWSDNEPVRLPDLRNILFIEPPPA